VQLALNIVGIFGLIVEFCFFGSSQYAESLFDWRVVTPISISPSVCLSVRPSREWIEQKLRKLKKVNNHSAGKPVSSVWPEYQVAPIGRSFRR
jgi:hypothetical protein